MIFNIKMHIPPKTRQDTTKVYSNIKLQNLTNFTFCWLCIMQWFLVNDPRDAQTLFYVFIFLFITLYMFRAHRAHNQERQIVSIQPLVTVTLCWWQTRVYSQPTHDTATNTEWQLTRGCIDTICLSWWWARCARNM